MIMLLYDSLRRIFKEKLFRKKLSKNKEKKFKERIDFLERGAHFKNMPQLSFHSPFGVLTLSEEEGQIVSLDEGRGRDQEETPLLCHVREMMQDYFDGEKIDFSAIALSLYGTDYQKKIWQALREIPYGETRSYSEIARIYGGSPQSVGQAVSLNPILILIPCHRVIGVKTLGGYSGFNGVEDKKRLLDLERGFED